MLYIHWQNKPGHSNQNWRQYVSCDLGRNWPIRNLVCTFQMLSSLGNTDPDLHTVAYAKNEKWTRQKKRKWCGKHTVSVFLKVSNIAFHVTALPGNFGTKTNNNECQLTSTYLRTGRTVSQASQCSIIHHAFFLPHYTVVASFTWQMVGKCPFAWTPFTTSVWSNSKQQTCATFHSNFVMKFKNRTNICQFHSEWSWHLIKTASTNMQKFRPKDKQKINNKLT